MFRARAWVVALLAIGLLTSTGLAQILYSNGPLSTGAMTQSGVAAPAGTTWSEVASQGIPGTEANTSAGFAIRRNLANSIHFRGADDFTVPAGDTWIVNGATFWAYQTGSTSTVSPFLTAEIRIWDALPTDGAEAVVCGDTTTNRLVSSTFDNMFRIFNTTTPPPGSPSGTTRPIYKNMLAFPDCVLGPGTYWVDWSYRMTADAAASFSPTVTVAGDRTGGVAGNARQFVTTAWQAVIDTGNPAAAPDIAQDFPFEIKGIPEPMSLSLLALGGLLIRRRR